MTKLIDKTLSSLEFSLMERNDFFITTSFGYQSSLLFFLMNELGVDFKCLYIKSDLAIGGVDQQMNYLTKKYKVELSVVDRNEWLESNLKGRDFMNLNLQERKNICKNLKREPLLNYIKENNLKIWISGIRKDQTKDREATQFLEVTDLNVIKISPLFSWSKTQAADLILDNGLRVNKEYNDLCKMNDTKECGLHY